jgi:hypothetical protein
LTTPRNSPDVSRSINQAKVTSARWLTCARSKHQIVDAVVAVRAARISWKEIGDILGTSAQTAQQRYGGFVEQV